MKKGQAGSLTLDDNGGAETERTADRLDISVTYRFNSNDLVLTLGNCPMLLIRMAEIISTIQTDSDLTSAVN